LAEVRGGGLFNPWVYRGLSDMPEIEMKGAKIASWEHSQNSDIGSQAHREGRKIWRLLHILTDLATSGRCLRTTFNMCSSKRMMH
jgi:hypothetical protein